MNRNLSQGLLLLLVSCSNGVSAQSPAAERGRLKSYTDTIPGTLVSFEMVPLPGEPALWIGRHEVTWEEYDVFAYRLDQPAGSGTTDVTARPSKPYGAPDYGWGHQGYPAISIAAPAAQAYAAWLSQKTGRKYRLPTDREWSRAAAAAFPAPVALDAFAWEAENSGSRAHPVGRKRADALGLFDLAGNAAEWVTGADGRPLTRGGSWNDSADRVGPEARAAYTSAWQERDPQFPKSRWWLSDGPFVGFRLVREP
jgi:formylglycine-generating enzyme required for sulfatase activity